MILQMCKKPFQWKVKEHTQLLYASQSLPSHKLPLKGLDITGWSSSCLPCSLLFCRTSYGPPARAERENSVPCYILVLQRAGH